MKICERQNEVAFAHVIEELLSSPLQEAEHESIELQEELDKLKEEKERLLNSLVEAE